MCVGGWQGLATMGGAPAGLCVSPSQTGAEPWTGQEPGEREQGLGLTCKARGPVASRQIGTGGLPGPLGACPLSQTVPLAHTQPLSLLPGAKHPCEEVEPVRQ